MMHDTSRLALNAETSRACRELEGKICDVDNMASLVASHVEGIMNFDLRTEQVVLRRDQVEIATFAVNHLQLMVADLKAKYYRAITQSLGATDA